MGLRVALHVLLKPLQELYKPCIALYGVKSAPCKELDEYTFDWADPESASVATNTAAWAQ